MLHSDKTLTKFGYLPSSLTKGSKKKVVVSCDYCGKELDQNYVHYINAQKSIIRKDSCKLCKSRKAAENIEVSGKKPEMVRKMVQTNILNYGVAVPALTDENQKNIKKSNLQKYGKEYQIESLETKEKSKKTMVERYGVEHAIQNKEIHQKKLNTTKKKYGVPHAVQSTEVKSEIRKNLLEKLGVESTSQMHYPEGVLEKLKDKNWLEEQYKTKTLAQISELLGLRNSHSTIGEWFYKHGIPTDNKGISKLENDVYSWIQSIYTGEIIKNDRKILAPKELDIWIPECKVAIEVCGLYWHSTRYKNKLDHAFKQKECEKLGIKLITLFEDEWNHKKEVVQKKILHLLNNSDTVYARKCEIVENLSVSEMKDFCNANHIQGYSPCKYSVGLKYNSELVALMTFGIPRYNKNYEWELIRYATSCSVVGGASKLFQHFLKEKNPQNVISYCDLRWGNGGVYSKIGFEYIKHTEPGYYYTDLNKKYNRLRFQKKTLVEQGYDSNKTEKQIVEDEMGLYKIYDCGNKVFEYKNLQQFS